MMETIAVGRSLALTRAGWERIRKELNDLEMVRRPAILTLMREAKELGDVVENPEYETAKVEQAIVEGRIHELREALQLARVLSDAEVSTERVGVGCAVVVRDLDTDEDEEIAVVSSVEADPDRDLISDQSPIGAALLGKRVGDRVTVQVPAGSMELEIREIRRMGE